MKKHAERTSNRAGKTPCRSSRAESAKAPECEAAAERVLLQPGRAEALPDATRSSRRVEFSPRWRVGNRVCARNVKTERARPPRAARGW